MFSLPKQSRFNCSHPHVILDVRDNPHKFNGLQFIIQQMDTLF
jgi:hypothetical protein